MIRDAIRFIDKEFLSEDKLADKAQKTRVLNIFSSKLKEMESSTLNKELIAAIASLKIIVEDAYTLTMYKFQFKLLTLAIQKEIQNIEDILALE